MQRARSKARTRNSTMRKLLRGYIFHFCVFLAYNLHIWFSVTDFKVFILCYYLIWKHSKISNTYLIEKYGKNTVSVVENIPNYF